MGIRNNQEKTLQYVLADFIGIILIIIIVHVVHTKTALNESKNIEFNTNNTENNNDNLQYSTNQELNKYFDPMCTNLSSIELRFCFRPNVNKTIMRSFIYRSSNSNAILIYIIDN